MYADLHMHSYYSDGTNTPAELVELAKSRGIRAIALSDHDTLLGISVLQKAALPQNIAVLPAVEISTSVHGVRIHVLGYNIDCSHAALNRYLNSMSDARTQNTRAMLLKLNELGLLKYSWEEVLEHHSHKNWLSSFDVFEAMRMDGFYKERSEAVPFHYQYFGKNSPAYRNLDSFSAESAVEIILEAGGTPVVAHPKLIGDDQRLVQLVRHGLRGIEAFYPAHNREDTDRYLRFAAEHNLFVTGGTDWHGDFHEWDAKMGDYGITEEQFLLLQEAHQSRK